MANATRCWCPLIALLIIASFANTASATLIVSIDGGWQIRWDTDVMCGTVCATDQFQFANYHSGSSNYLGYDLEILGSDGIARSAQSGAASSAISMFGFGTEYFAEDFYSYQWVGTSTAFAAVAPDAPTYARAGASVATSGLLYFDLAGTALFTGPHSLYSNGSGVNEYGSGDVLGPGQYWTLFHFTSGSGSSIPGLSAGQSAFDSDASVFNYEFRSVAVPEPATLLLLGAGFMGIAVARKRRSFEKRAA